MKAGTEFLPPSVKKSLTIMNSFQMPFRDVRIMYEQAAMR